MQRSGIVSSGLTVTIEITKPCDARLDRRDAHLVRRSWSPRQQPPEGVFLSSSTHPRPYGNVARFLGHYVRDRKLMPLEQAIRRVTGLPADNWKLPDRGCIRTGCYADLVVFDAAAIADHATYDRPWQFATGVSDVFVNGAQVVRGGEHTGATPGQVVRGPGWTGGREAQVGAQGRGHL